MYIWHTYRFVISHRIILVQWVLYLFTRTEAKKKALDSLWLYFFIFFCCLLYYSFKFQPQWMKLKSWMKDFPSCFWWYCPVHSGMHSIVIINLRCKTTYIFPVTTACQEQKVIANYPKVYAHFKKKFNAENRRPLSPCAASGSRSCQLTLYFPKTALL